jgi:hypothetical protein
MRLELYHVHSNFKPLISGPRDRRPTGSRNAAPASGPGAGAAQIYIGGLMPCNLCSSSGCKGRPCSDLERELPKMTKGFVLPISALTLKEIAVTASVSWGEVKDQILPSSEFKPFPFLGSRENDLLHDRICRRMRHKELAERYGLTPASCRMTLMRIRKKISKSIRRNFRPNK